MDLRLEIVDGRVVCRQNGREFLATDLPRFLEALAGRADFLALPDAIPEGVRFIRRRGEGVVLVIEEPPQVRTVRWLEENSRVPCGPGARYWAGPLAFPFVVLIVAFMNGGLTGHQQCFYRTSPVRTLEDLLCYPNLYNVAPARGKECWLCLEKLEGDLAPLPWRDKVRRIREHFWGAGFNRSAEGQDGSSYWRAMQDIDPRISSLAAWERESRRHPLFPLTVAWQPTGGTVGDVMQEVLGAVVPVRPTSSAKELAMLVSLCPP